MLRRFFSRRYAVIVGVLVVKAKNPNLPSYNKFILLWVGMGVWVGHCFSDCIELAKTYPTYNLAKRDFLKAMHLLGYIPRIEGIKLKLKTPTR